MPQTSLPPVTRAGLFGGVRVTGVAALACAAALALLGPSVATPALGVLFAVLAVWSAGRVDAAEAQRRAVSGAALESERRFRLLLEGVPQLIWTCAPDGRCDYLSRQWVEYTGLPATEHLGHGWADAIHPDDRERARQSWAASVHTGGVYHVEYRLRGREGDYRWFKSRGVLSREGDTLRWFGTCTDIDDLRRAERRLAEANATLERRVAERAAELSRAADTLRASEARFHAFMDHAPLAAWLLDENLLGVYTNRGFDRLTGLPPDSLMGRGSHDLYPPALAEQHHANNRRVQDTGQTLEDEERYERPDGTTGVAFVVKFPVPEPSGRPLVGGLALDITERKHGEERLRASLAEKDVLLREIHHRVKNNLQVVCTLLDLQSEYTADAAALELFRECQNRVRAMALIHERLYRSADLARVSFAEYTCQLADDLCRAYKVSDEDIRLELDVGRVALPIDLAIPCGLLLSELLSNCLKHAFPDNAAGRVRVTLHATEDGDCVLTVSDDGVGLPPGTDPARSASFGLQLVQTLAEQLAARLEFSGGCGTTFRVCFPVPLPSAPEPS